MSVSKILIAGGYGTFGGRLVELLEDEPRLTLIVAGRSLEKARAYCAARRGAKAQLVPAAFDRNGDVAARLAALKPDCVVDASGPFQAYGAKPYAVIDACIAARIPYLDLADGSDFVEGVAGFDAAARGAGLFVLSGVSSYPVLTAAAARALTRDMAQVETIRAGIAPSPYARIGENVMRAIASYAGKSVAIKRNGADTRAYALTEHRRFVIAPPGAVPLKQRLFSLVDAPDLRVLPKVWPEIKEVWVSAGTEPVPMHRMFVAFAWLVRLGLLPSLSFLAGPMHAIHGYLAWGEHRGGMFVEAEGTGGDGAKIIRSWHLIAEGDSGPMIPSVGIAAIVKKLLTGVAPPPGARPAVDELELSDYGMLFNGRSIVTGIREHACSGPLYRRVLESAWDRIPEPVRALHDLTDEMAVEGRADIDRGTNLLARLAAAIIGFPKAGRDVPVRVHFKAGNGAETWTRTFNGKSFSSVQYEGKGKNAHLLCERFGPLVFAMALAVRDGRMTLVLRRWSAFGIPMPIGLCPRADAYETAEEGRFRFHVEIRLPLAGLIVRYRGWLVPVTEPAPTP